MKMAELIQVLAGEALEAGPSTSGMSRSQAFTTETLWVGRAEAEAGAVSAWHHHGEHTSYGCVVRGNLRFEFGPGGAESIEVGPGDFFTVPPHAVHRESNPGSEEVEVVVVRSGTGPTVINVDGPEA
jgi:uncharacterized RmlC-like cupin family protein